MHRTARGAVAVKECATDGKFVVLENLGQKVRLQRALESHRISSPCARAHAHALCTGGGARRLAPRAPPGGREPRGVHAAAERASRLRALDSSAAGEPAARSSMPLRLRYTYCTRVPCWLARGRAWSAGVGARATSGGAARGGTRARGARRTARLRQREHDAAQRGRRRAVAVARSSSFTHISYIHLIILKLSNILCTHVLYCTSTGAPSNEFRVGAAGCAFFF